MFRSKRVHREDRLIAKFLLPLSFTSSSSSSSLMIKRPSEVTLKPCSTLALLFSSGFVAEKTKRHLYLLSDSSSGHHVSIPKSQCKADKNKSTGGFITKYSLGNLGVQEVERVIFLSFFEPGTSLLLLLFACFLLSITSLSFIL